MWSSWGWYVTNRRVRGAGRRVMVSSHGGQPGHLTINIASHTHTHIHIHTHTHTHTHRHTHVHTYTEARCQDV